MINKTVRNIFGLGAIVLLLSGCSSSKSLLSVTGIQGKWEIIEYNRQTIVPAPYGSFPYIIFTDDGNVCGQRGCNQWSGKYILSRYFKNIKIDIQKDGYLNCSQMTLDQKLKTAIKCISHYKVIEKGNVIVLYRKSPYISIVLRRQ